MPNEFFQAVNKLLTEDEMLLIYKKSTYGISWGKNFKDAC